MKKFFFLLCALITSMGVFAEKGAITTTFEYPEDEYVLYLNRFLNIGMIKAIITGDSLENKEYDIELIVCREGIFERKNLTDNISFSSRSDTITFYFITQPLSSDKVKVEFYGALGHKEEIDIDTSNSLLIEPENSTGFSYEEPIPIMAYSPGIMQEIEINGVLHLGMDVCGVRYSEINPSEWYDKLGIKSYFYFELVPKSER